MVFPSFHYKRLTAGMQCGYCERQFTLFSFDNELRVFLSTHYPSKAPVTIKRNPMVFRKTSSPVIRVFPAKQPRSEKTHKKLRNSGLALLNRGSFEDISIAQVASHTGCSVGSFYLRFRNKEAYFKFLVEGLSDELQTVAQQELTLERVKALSLTQTMYFCVDHFIEINRVNKGLIRAALLYGMNGSDDWQPIRELGLMLSGRYIDLIANKLRRSDADMETARKQLLIGRQIMSSHLINSIAHPGVEMPLHHPDLGYWMYEIVKSSLKVTPRKAHSRRSV